MIEGAAEPRPAPRRRWRRRLLWVAALLVAARVTVALALDPALRAVLSSAGVDARWEALSLDLLDARVEVRGLVVRGSNARGEAAGGPGAGAPLLSVRTLVGDLDAGSLLGGRLRVERLAVDGARVDLQRGAEGPWNLAAFAGGGAAEPAPEAAGSTLPTELPIEVVDARVQDLGLRLRDLQATPPVDVSTTVNVTLTGLGVEGRDGRLDLLVVSPECLDLLRLEARLAQGTRLEQGRGSEASLEAGVTVAGLRPEPLAGLLAVVGLEPRADELTASASVRVTERAPSSPAGGDASARRWEVDLLGVEVRADGALAFGLPKQDPFEVSLRPEIPGIELSDVVAEAALERDGSLTFAGLGVVAPAHGAPSAVEGPAQDSAERSAGDLAGEPGVDDRAVAAAPDAAGPVMGIAVGSPGVVSLHRSSLTLHDRRWSGAEPITARVESFTAGPHATDGRLITHLEGSVPGVVESLLVDASVEATAPRLRADGTVKLLGVLPEALRPYLALAGMAPAFEEGSFVIDRLGVDGLTFSAEGLAVSDAGDELAAIERVEVEVGGEDVVRVALEGARGSVRRRLDDSIEGLGLRFNVETEPDPRAADPTGSGATTPAAGSSAEGSAAEDSAAANSAAANSAAANSAAAETAAAASGASPAPFTAPGVWLPRLDLELEQLDFISDSNPLTPVRVGPVTVTTGRVAGTDAAFEATMDGTVRLAREFSASLRMDELEGGGLRVRGTTAARGVNLDPLEDWIELLGVESVLEDASLDANFDLGVRAVDGRPDLSLELGPVRLEDRRGGEVVEWLDVERMTAAATGPGAGGALSLASLALDRPRVRVERSSAGEWSALGVRVLPGEGTAADGEQSAGNEPSEDTGPAASGGFRVGEATLGEGHLTLLDHGGSGARVTEVDLGATVSGLAPGAGAPEASWSASLALGGATVTAEGTARPDPSDIGIAASLSLEGLDGAQLRPYLPDGVELRVSDGVGRARISGSWGAAAEGGQGGALQVLDLDLRERDADRPLAGVSELRVDVPQIDLAGGVVDVEQLLVDGLALEVVRLVEGGVSVAGVAVTAPEPSEARAAEPASDAAPPDPEGAPERLRLERVRLGALDLGVAALEVRTEGVTDPFVGTARIRLKDSVEFQADEFLEDVEPIELEIVGSASPGDLALDLALAMTPFDSEPAIDGSVAVRGMDAGFLGSVFPEMRSTDGRPTLDGGTFDADLHAQLRWRRNGPLDFDLRDGFGLGLRVSDLALRRTAGGSVALGLDLLDVDARRIAPGKRSFRLSRVEIDNPRAIVRRVPDGLSVAGVILVPEAGEVDSGDADSGDADSGVADARDGAGAGGEAAGGDAADREAADTEAAGTEAEDGGASGGQPGLAASSAQEPGASSPERPLDVALDDLVVRNIDVLYEDETVTPRVSIPLAALDGEVRGLSTRLLTEPRPVRFSLSLGGGGVSLPVRLKPSSLLRGVAEGVAGAVTSGKKEAVEYEERPLFREFATSGRLVLFPSVSGWVQTSLHGFELTALRGMAVASGVEIGDGTLDLNARTRLAGSRGGHVDSTVSLSHLSLSEPDGGPISRFLRLPAPLDTVIFVLKNEQGEIRLPLAFDFGGQSSMSVAELSAKASAAFLRLVTEALAAAPLRAVGSVTDVVGLGGLVGDRDRTPRLAGLRATVDFSTGSAHLDRELPPDLAALVDAMAEDPLLELEGVHHFGAEDIERARTLANPESDVARQLVASLRLQRDEAARRRAEVSTEARSALILGRSADFEDASARLTAVSRELGEVERRLDRVASLLGRAGAGKVERRRQRVALELAESRMDSITRALIRAGVDLRRVSLRRPRYEEPDPSEPPGPSRVELVTRAGTPRKGLLGRVLGVFGL